MYENYIISIIFRNLITMSATKRYHLIKENMKKNVTKFGNKLRIGQIKMGLNGKLTKSMSKKLNQTNSYVIIKKIF